MFNTIRRPSETNGHCERSQNTARSYICLRDWFAGGTINDGTTKTGNLLI